MLHNSGRVKLSVADQVNGQCGRLCLEVGTYRIAKLFKGFDNTEILIR